MNEWEKLRSALTEYLKKKFYSRFFISDAAEDIVNEAFSTVSIDSGKCNFGYLSKVCVHIAYRMFKRIECDSAKLIPFDDALDFMDERDVVDEIIASEDTSEILASLKILKEIEYIIVMQRYYGDFSFAEIAEHNSIKLNTVLSHHRRALEKLRPRLSAFADGRKKANRHNEHEAPIINKLY